MPDNKKKIIARLLPAGREIELEKGETVYAALAPRVSHFPGPCQGRGLCGLCRVKLSPAPPPLDFDRASIPSPLIDDGWRLACLHTLDSTADITLPEKRVAGPVITRGHDLPEPDPFLGLFPLKTGKSAVRSGRRVLEELCGEKQPVLAAALDLGTTNVSLQLIDISLPAVLGTAVTDNPQLQYGGDVLSRIEMASRPDGMKILRGLVLETFNSLAARLKETAGVGRAPIYELAVAANPVMAAIFAGIDPSGLARPPYQAPPFPDVIEEMSADGLQIHPRALVRIVPALGSFVGGDVAAGLVHAGVLPGDRRRTFYIDLGTNGEQVLKAAGRYRASSTAAGPALEGRRISYGMKADQGAIDSVRVDADITTTVLGGGPPRGLCGSGLLDLLSGLVKAGIIHSDGSLMTAEEASHYPRPRLARRLAERGGQRVFIVSGGPAGEIFFGQSDIRELQLAKGAVRAGIDILLDQAGLAADEMARVVVAGTFGFHLNGESLIGAGFLPQAWRGRIEFAACAALEGARECLLFRKTHRRVLDIRRRASVTNLAEHPRFRESFMANLHF